MRTIIAGSRTIRDYALVKKSIEESGFKITEVVSGLALGVDTLGIAWAKENKIPVKKFHAYWDRNGKSAGIIRNNEMACYADALIAVYDGKSRGTAHMIKAANEKGLKVFVATPSTKESE